MLKVLQIFYPLLFFIAFETQTCRTIHFQLWSNSLRLTLWKPFRC
jgi:hypothetical protein